jgi:hypothetical protein
MSKVIHGLFLLIPAQINFPIAGPDETKNRARRGVLRLVQIRLATASLEKISLACQDKFAAGANGRLKFERGRQLFIRTRDETLSIVGMRVRNPDCSPASRSRTETQPKLHPAFLSLSAMIS